MINREFIEAICELHRDARDPIEIDGMQYAIPQYKPIPEPIQAALQINTLTGLVDYIKLINDKKIPENLFFVVENYKRVALVEKSLTKTKNRTCHIGADYNQSNNILGGYIFLEDFIINLQTQFVPDNIISYLLQIVSGMTDAHTKEIVDDGITQKATVKDGISMLKLAEIPNPVEVRPYATFPEITQPSRKCVFRVQRALHNQEIQCGLFPSQDDLWENDIIIMIKLWLQKRLPGIPVIA